MTERVNLVWHDFPGSGYGNMGSGIKDALVRRGVKDYGHLLREAPGGSIPDPDIHQAPVALWLSTPPHMKGFWSGQLNTIFTMWEYTELPGGFRDNLHHADRVFVPSRQNLELFRRFHDDVRYVPLGIDPAIWKPTPRHMPGKEFHFLAQGSGPRKNTMLADKAFRRVFGAFRPTANQPTPKLTMVSRQAIPGKNIIPITTKLSLADEVALYERSHCFVSTSRGEGWGLMPTQALAQGLPTILPDAHGHEAFAALGIPITATPVPCGHATFWGDSGEWWEPNLDEMCEAMWEIYNDYAPIAEDAALNAPIVGGTWNWDRTVDTLMYHLPELQNDDPPKGEWHDAQPRLYRVVTNQTSDFLINGIPHHFEKGVAYDLTYDMKCTLGRQGRLDPICIDPLEMGMEAQYASRATEHSSCPTCHQPLPREQRIHILSHLSPLEEPVDARL